MDDVLCFDAQKVFLVRVSDRLSYGCNGTEVSVRGKKSWVATDQSGSLHVLAPSIEDVAALFPQALSIEYIGPGYPASYKRLSDAGE